MDLLDPSDRRIHHVGDGVWSWVALVGITSRPWLVYRSNEDIPWDIPFGRAPLDMLVARGNWDIPWDILGFHVFDH